jgi:hypothetical protein
MPAVMLMSLLRAKLLGYYRYYGVTDNGPALCRFNYEVENMLFKWLNRRSQKKSLNFKKFKLFLGRYPLPKPKIYVNIYMLFPVCWLIRE